MCGHVGIGLNVLHGTCFPVASGPGCLTSIDVAAGCLGQWLHLLLACIDLPPCVDFPFGAIVACGFDSFLISLVLPSMLSQNVPVSSSSRVLLCC